MPHVRICAGGGQRWLSLPRPRPIANLFKYTELSKCRSSHNPDHPGGGEVFPGGSTVTLTVTATLNGRVKNTSVTYTIAGARLDSVRVFSSRASGDALPGEAVTVTAIAQSANGSVPPVQIEPRNLLGAGATVGSPVSAPNQPAGTARVSRVYTAPRNLPQRSAELFAASFPATAASPPLPTVTSTRNLNVAALRLDAPLSICAAASISASASSNLVSGTFSWQLNAEPPVTGPSFFRNGAVGGNLRLDLQSNGVTVKTQNIGVTTAGCTLAVIPAYISLLPGQTQQFTTNPPAANLTGRPAMAPSRPPDSTPRRRPNRQPF